MRKPVPPGRRQRANAQGLPAREDRGLLQRILDTPHLAQVVPRLQPEMLHRIVETCGLEDCGEIVALATPGQLQAVFDLDLWRPARPGLDERLDPDRFLRWLEVLLESGAAVAAQKLIGIDVDLVATAIAEHLLVVDAAAAAPFMTLDGELVDPRRRRRDAVACEVGGYRIEAKRTDGWDALVELLLILDAEHGDYFHRMMDGCRGLSNSTPEIDGLDDLLNDNDQAMFDLAVDRERRREKQGYVTPAQARAFLHAARQLQRGYDDGPPPNPVATAYFRAVEFAGDADPSTASASPDDHDAPAEALSAVVGALIEAGVLTGQPRALLGTAQDDARRLAALQRHMQFAHEHDAGAYSSRTAELAYLANTIVAGCSIQGRPFTASEASDAAAAVCNLGLENWPRFSGSVTAVAGLPEGFLVDHDLVGAFQIGWKVLYDDVCMFAADRLIRLLADLQCDDAEIQSGLAALRARLATEWRAGMPWRAQGALDVIATLDLPAWAALVALTDELPVMHGAVRATQGSGVRSISATAFEFISENSQIAYVRTFIDALPELLAR